MVLWKTIRWIERAIYMIIDIEEKLENKDLTIEEVEDLLLKINWLEEPEVIRKLLHYKKTLSNDNS